MTPTPQSNQQPTQSADKPHFQKYAVHYLAVLLAGAVSILQLAGQLAPIVCQFSKNPAQCIVLGKAAGQTGELLDKSGVMVKLDEVQVDGTVQPLVDADGGQ